MKWWGITLIVLASLILVGAVLLIIIALVESSAKVQPSHLLNV